MEEPDRRLCIVGVWLGGWRSATIVLQELVAWLEYLWSQLQHWEKCVIYGFDEGTNQLHRDLQTVLLVPRSTALFYCASAVK